MAQHTENTGRRAISIRTFLHYPGAASACSIARAKRGMVGLALAAVFFLHGGPPVFAQGQEQPAAASSAGGGTQQFADLGDFKLLSGAIIRNCRLGYRTLGNLNAQKSNGVVWSTWLGGTTKDLLPNVSPGNVVDTRKYFAILVDAIGNGISSSPSNSKIQPLMRFPEFTIRDMVNAEHELVTTVLRIPHLHAVVGISMGGMQTFEWMAAYPDFMDEAIAIMGSAQSTSYDKLIWTAQIDAIEADPKWNHGRPTGMPLAGLRVVAEMSSINETSPSYRSAKTPPQDFEAFLKDLRNGVGGEAGTAADWIRQRQAIISFDVPGEFGGTMEQAAARVRAKVLIMVSPRDQSVNPASALEFARLLKAPVIILDSSCGHISPSCISIGPLVDKFLADPTSVQSTTLHDPPEK
jgi:homoserine O-acetyltransferase